MITAMDVDVMSIY